MARATKRDDILKIAGNLFIQHGFQAVSVEQIAAAVPVSKPTLYAHFKDKRELFVAVIAQRCERALASLKDGIAEGHKAEKGLRNFAAHFLDLLLSKEALQFHRVMVAESLNFPDMAQMFYETGPRQTRALLEQYLGQLHDKGELHIPDPGLSADIFVGMLKGPMHLRCLLNIDAQASDPKLRDRLIDAAVSVFIKGHARQ